MADGGPDLSFLKKDIGGIPAPVIIVGVGGIIGWYILRTRKSAKASTPTVVNTGAPGGFVDASGMGSYIPAGSNAGSSTGSGSGSGSGNSFADNNAWASAAINYLVGLGYDAAGVNVAVSSYLSGQTLTTQQTAWVNVAIQHLGSPPTLVTPTVIGSPVGGVPVLGGQNPGTPDAPPNTNYVPHVAMTLPNETMYQFVQRVYTGDPSVSGANANPAKITQQAQIILSENTANLKSGVNTPQQGGILVTYY